MAQADAQTNTAPIAASVNSPAPVVQPAVEAAKEEATVAVAAKPAKPAAKRARTVKAPAAVKPAARRVASRSARKTSTKTPQAAAQAPAAKKETVKMATKTKKPQITAAFEDSFKDASAKAKAAFEKSQAAFGDAGEFAKGNLEAVVASGKVLANGVKAMGEAYVAETRSAYETLTADIKELAAVKSPVEFFELQSKLFRKNFDAAVVNGSKKSEEVLKLANEAFQPVSTRISLAMEKIKRAA